MRHEHRPVVSFRDAPASSGEALATGDHGQRVHILLIEDDHVTRQVFQLMLEEAGHTVQGVSSVPDGLAAVSRGVPDMILLDLHLPIMDGLECLRQLRASHAGARVPVAILTADYFLDEDIASTAHALGARIHFKPIWDADLRRIVSDLVALGAGR